MHPDDFAHTMSVYATAFDARVPFEAEFRLKRHDGEYRWVFNRGTPRFDEDERFEGYIGAALDVTDRKAAEEALGHADRRQNEFLALLAHELRNPLAPIRNAVQIMERINSGQDARIDHAREVIDRQSGKLTRLIDDLLEVSRIDSGKVTLRRERSRCRRSCAARRTRRGGGRRAPPDARPAPAGRPRLRERRRRAPRPGVRQRAQQRGEVHARRRRAASRSPCP